jgi:hypothetical protein
MRRSFCPATKDLRRIVKAELFTRIGRFFPPGINALGDT